MAKTAETKLLWTCDLKKPGNQDIKEMTLLQRERWSSFILYETKKSL